MIDFARPGFLVAGVVAAGVPLVLHLIARRPPERAALPTLRFLSPDSRTAIRVRRRPTDLLLLALRMLLLALVGAGLAGPAWFPDREGTAEVVMLDRGIARLDAAAWRRAVDDARRRLLGPEGEARGELVLFDSAATRVPHASLTPAWFDSLASASPPSPSTPVPPTDYAAALRALPDAGRELRGADSARVTLLTVPRWTGWRPGLASVRRAAWPGAITVPGLRASIPRRGAASGGDAAARGTAVVLAEGGAGAYASAALAATGWTVRRASPRTTLGEGDARLLVVLSPASAEVAREVGERLRRGAGVVVSGDAATGGLASLLPWRGARATDGGGEIRLSPELRLEAAGRVGGGPGQGAAVIAAWDDGRPAASARRVGAGCAVFVAAALEGGRMPLSAAYPRALDRLARGCAGDAESADEAGRLDSGALSVLRGQGKPPVVAVSAVAGPGGGTPLGRWVLAAALAVALGETALAYGRRERAG